MSASTLLVLPTSQILNPQVGLTMTFCDTLRPVSQVSGYIDL